MTLPPAAMAPFAAPTSPPIVSPADIGVGASRVAGTAVDDSPAARVEIWGVPFDVVTRAEAVDRVASLVMAREPSYLITANLHYVMLHNRMPELRSVTKGAALVLADGQPIVWRSRLGERLRPGQPTNDSLQDRSAFDRSASPSALPERVTGSELIFDLARRAAELGWRIYFLGGRPGVAERCARRLVSLYPGLQIAGVESPPFRELDDRERADQEERIRRERTYCSSRTASRHHYRRLRVPMSVQLGASFDFVAGEVRRAPSAVGWSRTRDGWGRCQECGVPRQTLFRELTGRRCGWIGSRRP